MASLPHVLCFLLTLFLWTDGCSGPERNSIQEKLINVDWKVLTDQLDLTSQTRSIHGACYKELDAVTCYLREIIGRFIDSQPPETCNKTVEKIAIALEKLGKRYWKEVHELRRMIATGDQPTTVPPQNDRTPKQENTTTAKMIIFTFILSAAIIIVLFYLMKPKVLQEEWMCLGSRDTPTAGHHASTNASSSPHLPSTPSSAPSEPNTQPAKQDRPSPPCTTSLDPSSPSISPSCLPSTPTTSPTCIISSYAAYLKAVYNSAPLAPDKFIPYLADSTYVKLALVKKGKVTQTEADELTRLTFEADFVDQILSAKEEIKIDDILKGENTRLVVVEGAPGIGKSTLAWELCRQWHKLESLKHFSLVVLLKLRENEMQSAKSISDLFFWQDEPDKSEEVAKSVKERNGKGVLFVVDGFDEFPADLRKSSDTAVMKVIKETKYLPDATVVLTSRHSAVGDLDSFIKPAITKHIEIVGFAEAEVQSYAEHILGSGTETLTRFNTYLSANPVVKGMMYNPLNCAIILEVYQAVGESGRPIPHTQTQLYTDMTLWRLSRYLNEKGDTDFPSSLEDLLHSDLYQQLMKVGKLAYDGLVKGRVKFKDLPEGCEDLGLLVKHTALYGLNKTTDYNFFHLTMQEYMSAFYISQLPVDQQRTLLVKDGISNVVWRFVAGLTKMKDIGWDMFSEYVESVRKYGHASELVIQCLYESQNMELLERKFGPNIMTFKNDQSISNYDAFALGYCISMSRSTWDITVSRSPGFPFKLFVHGLKCGVLDESINSFALYRCNGIINGKEHLLEIPDPILQHIKSLSFRDCGINQTGFMNLAECLPSLHSLTSLELNEHAFATAGVAVLLQKLRDHRKLKSLSLDGMDIDVDAANALVQLSLRELNISPMAMVLYKPPAAEVYQKLGRSLLSSASLEKLTMYNFFCTVLDGMDDISDNISTLNLHFHPQSNSSRWSRAYPRVKYGTKISHILRRNTSLKELELKVPLDEGEVCDILHSLEDNHTLERLVLVDDDYIYSFASVVMATNYGFRPSMVNSGIYFSKFLRRNNSLKELIVEMELYKGEVWNILHSLEENHTLEKLVVFSSANEYGPLRLLSVSEQSPAIPCVEGGTMFGNFLKSNTSLKELCIEIPLDIDDVHDILHSLEENNTLEKLELTDHDYTKNYDWSYRPRRRSLKPMRTELASEYLPAANPSGVKGGTRLGNFLRRNTSLKHLKLFFQLDNDEVHDIVESMEDNHTLEVLELSKEYRSLCSSMSKKEPRISWIRR